MLSLSPLNWHRQRKAAKTLARFIDQWTATANRQAEERRKEDRVALTVPMYLVPLHGGTPILSHAREVISKDVSTSGIGLLSDTPVAASEMFLIIPQGKGHVCLQAKRRSITPVGQNFYQVGVEVVEEVSVAEFPELRDLGCVVESVQRPRDSAATIQRA
jgi:hypothetical protein